MSYLLSEIFGESSTYMMGIAFETISYDQEKNSNVKRKGWEIPYLEADINDIDAYATKYQIMARKVGDAHRTWDSLEPFKDGMTGDETFYILVVKNLDWSDISSDEFREINEKIKDNESWGVTVNARPLTMSH
jgi:hypothetical protein